MVVLLTGGTGGAKVARGMLDVVGAEELCVVANTADDVEVYGVHVSPDPDLVALWLADLIDARGFGLRDDTWEVMQALERAGRETWFRLGDRDLALCLVRTELLRSGRRLTEAHAEVVRAVGLDARVLPMCDEPVRTHVRAAGRVRPIQEFMIVDRAKPAIEGVELRGSDAARPTPEVLAAIEDAEAIVIGPSNPVISIGPILAVPGLCAAVARASAPVIAISPFVGGRAVKGPTEAFCAHAGIDPSARGIAAAYAGIVGGLVADEPVQGVPAFEIDTLMDTPADRARVARAALDLAREIDAG
ncbi:MAG TPA: 2-phospho-L-lactate transferase [Thermoleophilaceae bacterium]|nr:2-phospho-L-lactate transferase [Thermoleophilaceae bacterium]